MSTYSRKILWVLVSFWLACRETGTRGVPTPVPEEVDGGVAGGGDGGVAGRCPPGCPPPPPVIGTRQPAPNPIPAENARRGNPEWRDGTPVNARQVELYTSTESVMVGDTVRVMVSSARDAQVQAEVYRLGYYGGAGARRVWSGGPFNTQKQPECPRDPVTSLVECHWQETFRFEVPDDWVSGLYVVKVRRDDGFKLFHPFVVRDSRAAEVLFTPAFNTYQAYNTYGGESLYYDGSGTMPMGRANAVSYDRPYVDAEGGGKTFNLDVALLRLLEQHGYDVTYASNLDFARYSNLLEGIGAMVHGGQDEYWLSEERTQVDAALAAGTLSLAYFGGNGAYWRTRAVSSGSGQPLRTLLCFKSEPEKDPIPYSTVRFRDPPRPQPENGLFGVMYDGWELVSFPLVVADEHHWLFEGTGVRRGTQLVGLVGFEFDRVWNNGFHPEGVHTPLESPVVTAEGLPNVAHGVERTLPNGRLVFAAGTIYWPLALNTGTELSDVRVVRMTLNVLERALEHRRPRRTLTTPPSPLPPAPRLQPVWAAKVEAFAGAPGAPGYRDGPGAVARFNGPTGVAVLEDGAVVVADTNNERIRLVRADAAHTVVTIAGNGDNGWRDGDGLQAMFRRPTGVAAGRNGTVYVADSDNDVIRLLTPTTGGRWTVSTFAGQHRSAGYRDGPAATALFSRPTYPLHRCCHEDGDDAGGRRSSRVPGCRSGEPGALQFPERGDGGPGWDGVRDRRGQPARAAHCPHSLASRGDDRRQGGSAFRIRRRPWHPGPLPGADGDGRVPRRSGAARGHGELPAAQGHPGHQRRGDAGLHRGGLRPHRHPPGQRRRGGSHRPRRAGGVAQRQHPRDRLVQQHRPGGDALRAAHPGGARGPRAASASHVGYAASMADPRGIPLGRGEIDPAAMRLGVDGRQGIGGVS
jgi:hypothetical protein